MGEFDDVLAMEPGDEWDAFDAGGALGVQDQVPVAVLDLAGVVVHVVGEVPDEVVGQLGPLTAETAQTSQTAQTVPTALRAPGAVLAVTAQHDGSWDLAAGADVATVHDHAGLVRAIERVALAAAERCDPERLHLRCAAVGRPDGTTMLLVSEHEQLRAGVLAALVAHGAAPLGVDRVVLTPGSRVAAGVATIAPVATAVADAGLPTVTVFIDAGPGGAALERFGRAHGCARLLRHALTTSDSAAVAVESIGALSGAMDFCCLTGSDPAAMAAAVGALGEAGDEDLVVHQWLNADATGPEVIRVGRTGVLVDAATGSVVELADDELATIDGLLWSATVPRPAEHDDVVARLALAGFDLAPVVPRARTLPGPQSYGLSDSPCGAASAEHWADDAVADLVAREPALASPLAWAARCGDLRPGATTAARLEELAAAQNRRSAAVLAALEVAVQRLVGAGIVPLVLGAPVQREDGVLPRAMTVLDRVEVLVARDDRTDAVEVLRSSGDLQVVDMSSPAGAEVDPKWSITDGEVPVLVYDRVATGPFGELVDHEELHERSVPVWVGGRWTRALHPADRFVAECVRHELVRGPRLSAARSVAITSPGSGPGVAAALEASERWGATRAVLAAVRDVGSALPGLAPQLIARATRSDSGTRGLSRWSRRR